MFETSFEGLRNAQESVLQFHQELLGVWLHPLGMSPPGQAGMAGMFDWGRSARHRLAELTVEQLDKQREALDGLARAAIRLVEETFQLWEARSPESLRQTMGELWRQLLEISQAQSELPFREVQRWVEGSFAMNSAAAAHNGK
jgi:hypothetical protein